MVILLSAQSPAALNTLHFVTFRNPFLARRQRMHIDKRLWPEGLHPVEINKLRRWQAVLQMGVNR